MDPPHPRLLERLVGGTRLQILKLLQRSDRTVQEIAEEVGISANAVRGHLSALERDGLVAQRSARRDTGGKPAVVYALSTEGDEIFPKAYAVVLTSLLEVLDDRMGEEGLQSVLSEAGARAAPRAGGSPRDRVESAAAVLGTLGGAVDVRREGSGWRIRGFSCPLSSVIQKDHRVCGLARALVAHTTGGSVVEECDRGDRPRCSFRVSFPSNDDG